MGNIPSSCPRGFVLNPIQPFTCIVQCPADKGFQFEIVSGKPTCAFKEDLSYNVPITPIPALQKTPDGTLVGDQTLFTSEKTAFDTAFPVVYAKIDKKRALDVAFRALQDAENVRDKSPQAYQDARTRYYTLLKGEDWKNEEAQRIARAEVTPVVTSYQSKISDIQSRADQQKRTIDLIQGVKDKLLSAKDDLSTSVKTFQKQIDTLKNQIQVERHAKVEEDTTSWSYLDLGLNILIFFILLGLIAFVVRKMSKAMRTDTTTQLNRNLLRPNQ
jgi:hypothetical protein